MDTITIRPLTDDDLPGLRALIVEHQDYHRALEPQWPAGADVVTDYLAYLQAECVEHDGAIFMAADGPNAAGFVCVVADKHGAPDDPARHAFVHDLFVAGAYRRRGLGTRLMDAAEAFAVSRGAVEIRLAVLERNSQVRVLYEGLNFRGYSRLMTKRISSG